MFWRRVCWVLWGSILVFAMLASLGCGGGGGGSGGDLGGENEDEGDDEDVDEDENEDETPDPDLDTTAPTASLTPASGATLTATSSIVIQFSESMSRASISIGGTGASGVVQSWSTTSETDDTLTLTGNWVDGDSNTITVDGSDLSSNAMTQELATYHILGNDVVYVATTGNDSNSGAHDAPKLTIEEAFETRDDLSLSEIHVAKGSYDTTGLEVVYTLKGGYTAADWDAARDLSENATIINNVSSANGSAGTPNYTVSMAYNSSIDGFTILGASSANYSAGVYVNSVSTVTVSNCYIEGGAGSTLSSGIQIGTIYGDCLFSANYIDAGSSTGAQYGFYMSAAQSSDTIIASTIVASGAVGCSAAIAIYSYGVNGITISANSLSGGEATLSAGFYQHQGGFIGYRGTIANNTIHGGDGTTAYGIRLYKGVLAGTTTVQNNRIYGGNGTNTTGVVVNATDENRPYVITQCLIHGGTATDTSIGISNDVSSATITNNAIFGGVGVTTRGISVLQSASPYYPYVYNNTINGGNASGTSSAIYASFSMDHIENNILLTSAGSSRYALNYWVQGGSAQYNAYVDGATILLHTRWNCGSACIDYNTLNDIHAQLDGDDVDYLDSIDAIDFVNGSDPDDVWSVTDYSLANTSSANIKTGGLDGDAEAWGFTVDLLNSTRTGSGGFGWSIGAFEY